MPMPDPNKPTEEDLRWAESMSTSGPIKPSPTEEDLKWAEGVAAAPPGKASEVTPTMDDYEILMKAAPDVLTPGTPQFNAVLGQINDRLREEGWSSEDIAKANFPLGINGMQVGMLTDEQYKRMREIAVPIMQDNMELLFDEADVASQILEAAGEDAMGQFDWSILRQYLGRWQEAAGQALGRERRTWSRWQRQMSEEAADLLRDPLVELDAGLLMLDGARWLDAKWKLNWVDEEDRDDLVDRTLRTVTFTDPRRPDEEPQEYSNGFTAAMHVLRTNAGLRWQQATGYVMRDVGKMIRVLPGERLEKLGQDLQGRGQVRGDDALAAMQGMEYGVYQTIALTGEPIEWYQVLESYAPESGVEEWYAAQERAGLLGDINLALMAGGSAVAELVIDPLLLLGPLVKGAGTGARAVAGRVAPRQAARIAEAVARKTHHAADAAEALRRADKYVEVTNAEYLQNPTIEGARRVQSAWQQRQSIRRFNRRFSDVEGEVETIGLRTAKRNPMTIDLRTTEEYVARTEVPRGVTTAEQTDRAITRARERIQGLQQKLADTPSTRTPLEVQATAKELDDIAAEIQLIRRVPLQAEGRGLPHMTTETERAKKIMKLRRKAKTRTERLLRSPSIEENPAWRSSVEQMDRAIDDLVEGLTREGVTIEHGAAIPLKATRQVGRPADELAAELHAHRVKAAEIDLPQPVEWDDFGPVTKRGQRLLFGPDDTEQAGDGLAQMVESGGTAIDDIATVTKIGNPTPEYNVSVGHGNKDAFIDWKGLDRQNDITRLERQFMSESRRRAVARIDKLEARLREFTPGEQISRADAQDIVREINELKANFLTHTGKGPKVSFAQLNLLEDPATTVAKAKKVASQLRRNYSATRLSIRQRQLANVKHGRARNSGDDRIRQLADAYRQEERRLADAQKVIEQADENWWDDVVGGGKLKWLPVQGESIMDNPNLLERWIEASGHRLHRSLYPGGVAMNMMEIIGGIDALTDPIARLPRPARAAVGAAGAAAGGAAGFIAGGIPGAVAAAAAGGALGYKGSRAMRGYGHALSLFREPHRFFGHYAPREWQEIRAGVENYHQQTIRDFDFFTTLAERAGIVRQRAMTETPVVDADVSKIGKSRGRRALKPEGFTEDIRAAKTAATGPFEVDKEASERIFDILDINRALDEVRGPDGKVVRWGDDAGDKAGQPMTGQEYFDSQLDELSDAERDFVVKTQQWLDHSADQQGISDTERYITGYIHHVWRSTDFANGARPLEYIGMPGRSDTWAAHLLQRTGETGYEKDVMLALDFYTRGVNRKLHMEPVYQRIIETGDMLAKRFKRPALQTYANSFVSELKGQPTFLGTRLDELIGAGAPGRAAPNTVDRALMGVTALWWAGALPGNPRYPIMQVATSIATTSGRFGLYRTARGLFQQATTEGRALSKASGVERQIQQVFESDVFRRAADFVSKAPVTISPLGVTSTAGVENMIRGMTHHAAIDMYLTKYGFATLEEAKAAGMMNRILFDSLRASEEVNHVFGAGGRSPYLTRMTGRGPAAAATQFLSFVPKQLEELAAQAWRDPGMIAEYMAVSGYLSLVAAATVGVDLTDYVGMGFLPTEPRELQSPAMKAFLLSVEYLSAWSAYDKAKMADVGEQLIKQMQAVIPLSAGPRAAQRGAERIQEGVLRSGRGHLERRMDFDGLMQGEMSLAEAIDPDARQGLPALGGDLFPAATGLMAIQDRLHYVARSEFRKTQQDTAFQLQKRVRRAIDALDDGDTAAFQEQFNAIANDFNLGDTSADPFVNEIVARQISWVLRNLKPGDPQVLHLLDIARELGMQLE